MSSDRAKKILFTLILTALLAPHTLELSRSSLIDNSYIRITLAAICWTLIRDDGSTIAGPYSSTLFPFPTLLTLLWTILFFPFYLYIIYAQWRFTREMATKRSVLRAIVVFLLIQLLVLTAFFSYSLDGWASTAAYPLPIFHVISVLSTLWFHKAERVN